MYDTIIIGGGPAGLTAAIYAARREMKTLLITRHVGGQMIWASTIENYPAFKEITALELIAKMEEQVKSLGVEIKLGLVEKLEKNADKNFSITLGEETFQAKTVIAALGCDRRKLGVPGENDFAGLGVAYCANCDGPLFRNKIVAVVGGGNSALDSAEMLSKIASKVYLIHQFEVFQAFEALEKKVRATPNIEIILENKVEEILGSNKVEKIKIKNQKTSESSEINLNGIFVEIGFEVKTDLVAGLIKLNGRKEIIIDEHGETSMSGLFAAGDATTNPYKQITVAAGAGTVAALGAYRYIQTKEGNLAKLIK
ncbi:MAG: FAD-dependent oxidoreductase [Patescibacteria group bacterium]|jgi:alkyl hydroperoxide reductase subunit F